MSFPRLKNRLSTILLPLAVLASTCGAYAETPTPASASDVRHVDAAQVDDAAKPEHPPVSDTHVAPHKGMLKDAIDSGTQGG